MDLQEVAILPESGKKGRSFRALALASATADGLWPGGATKKGDVTRPVMAVFLGSEAEMRPFAANLQLGRVASTSEESYRRRGRQSGYEFLKSAGYKQIWQRHPEGAILTVYLPDLYTLDPGMVDPTGARFAIAPTAAWAAAQEIPVAEMVRHARRLPIVREVNTLPEEKWQRDRFEKSLPDEKLAALASIAWLFAAYLDRRTRVPIVADGRFYLQVMLACLKRGLASWSVVEHSYGTKPFGEHPDLGFFENLAEGCGLLPGIAFKATHEEVEAVLAEEVEVFYKVVGGK